MKDFTVEEMYQSFIEEPPTLEDFKIWVRGIIQEADSTSYEQGYMGGQDNA